MNIDKKKIYHVGEYTFVNFINLDDETIEKIRVWRNHPDICKVMYNTEEISKENHFNFIKSLSNNDSKFYWLVYKYETPIGVMNVVDVDYEKSNGQLGYYLLPQFLSSGIGLEFISTLIYFIFSELEFKSLFGRTEVGNKDALRFNYHLGFKMFPKVVEIDGIRFIEQNCTADNYLSKYVYITDPKELQKSIKEFNRIYYTLDIIKR